MRWTIRQTGATWEVVRDDHVLAAGLTSYGVAMAALAASAMPALTAAGAPGLLDEAWQDVAGIAFSAPTGDGRDFTGCAWSWRDPDVSLLPLMLQTSTDVGHFGATLAGYLDRVWLEGDTPHASGRFYATPEGEQFRDLLLDGRRFGVSVDPGETQVSWVCLQEDADGWCVEDSIEFAAYQIIGLTGTPFPAFAEAAIHLTTASTDAPADPAPADAPADPTPADAPQAIAASAFPAVPPRSWFAMPEPAWGDELLVEQLDEYGHPNGQYAVPLTITDDGQVFGHMAYWGQCHAGWQDAGICVEPPRSPSGYARFNLRPTPTDDGAVLTGPLVVGCDHADLSLFEPEARDHYATAGLAWADVVVSEGEFGPWFCGALRPDVTPEQLRVLRSSSVSGDWRPHPAGLELILGLTVNGPGFPIRGRASERALAAAGLALIASGTMRVRTDGTNPVALVAANVVRQPCRTCGQASTSTVDAGADLAEIRRTLAVLERRTRHLIGAAGPAIAARFRPVQPAAEDGR